MISPSRRCHCNDGFVRAVERLPPDFGQLKCAMSASNCQAAVVLRQSGKLTVRNRMALPRRKPRPAGFTSCMRRSVTFGRHGIVPREPTARHASGLVKVATVELLHEVRVCFGKGIHDVLLVETEVPGDC